MPIGKNTDFELRNLTGRRQFPVMPEPYTSVAISFERRQLPNQRDRSPGASHFQTSHLKMDSMEQTAA